MIVSAPHELLRMARLSYLKIETDWADCTVKALEANTSDNIPMTAAPRGNKMREEYGTAWRRKNLPTNHRIYRC